MKHKALFKYTVIFLAVIAGSIIAGSFYMLDFALKPQNRGRDIEGSCQYMYSQYPHLKPWADSLKQVHALKDTFIQAKDGTMLHAFYAKAARPTGKTAVIIHGYTDNAIRMFMIGYLYNKKLNYNILLPDLRNTGLSQGEYIQMGWRDRLDVLRWLDMANAVYGDTARIVVHGISMGAATTMMVSGEPQPASVKCYIEDCGYTSVWDEFAYQLKETFGLPAFPIMHATSTLCKMRYGWDFREASAIKQVSKCHKPMLFIHGETDTFVPTWMVHELYKAKPEPKELWLAPTSVHAMSYKDNPDEYTARVKNFVDKYIP